MLRELILAAFIMSVGICVAAIGTHLYQWLVGRQAVLRYGGETGLHTVSNIAIGFVCGPYILLHAGWHQERGGALSLSSALFSAFVAFGWAFVTGLLVIGAYLGATA